LQLVLSDNVLMSLTTSRSLPQLFQCVRQCACSLLSRGATWARIAVACPETLISPPENLAHSAVLLLAIPNAKKALLVAQIVWEIKASENGTVDNTLTFDCKPARSTEEGKQVAMGAEEFIKSKLAVGLRLDEALTILIKQLNAYL
jgi:hypothetical protein